MAALVEAGAIGSDDARVRRDLPAAVREFRASDIKRLREALKFSQPVFALHLHTSASTVRKWEQGETPSHRPCAQTAEHHCRQGLASPHLMSCNDGARRWRRGLTLSAHSTLKPPVTKPLDGVSCKKAPSIFRIPAGRQFVARCRPSGNRASLETPFGSKFRLDVAVLGPPVQAEPMVLGGVEIELGHAFDGRKALIGKSLGFPLISIDITEMTLAELTPEWAQQVLTATTRATSKGAGRLHLSPRSAVPPLCATAGVSRQQTAPSVSCFCRRTIRCTSWCAG